MAAKGQTIEAEDVERVAHLIQPALDLRGFGGVMVTDALDAGLDYAEGHAGEMEVGVVNALKPGEHGAMGARPTAALPRGGTNTAASVPRRETTCGPSL
jgi:hypothetical protein